jgi:hypothetical protein
MVNETRIGGTVGFCSNATIKTNSLLAAHSAPPPKVLQSGNSVQESILPKQNLVNQISSIVSKKQEADQPKEVKNSTLKVSPILTPLNKVPKNSETKIGMEHPIQMQLQSIRIRKEVLPKLM